MENKITLNKIADFLDMEPQYLKAAMKFFAPELMEPYKDFDLDDESKNEKFIFSDTKDTWMLVAFAVCNSFLEDITEASNKLEDVLGLLGVN